MSTTYRMPGTVSDVSATFVASTTRRTVAGWDEKTRCCSAAESREKSGTTSRVRPGSGLRSARASAVSRISRSPGRKTRTSPGPSCGELAYGVEDRLGLVADDGLALLVGLWELDQGPVAHLDRVGPAGDLDHRRGAARLVGEVAGEAVGVDGGRGDHELEVGPAWQQSLEVAEEEVDVEAALVRLVDDDRVVAAQLSVALELGQQDAVGHHLDPGLRTGAVGEPHLVADLVTQRRTRLLGEAFGDRTGRDPAGLGVPDQAAAPTTCAAAQLEADLGQLGGLPGAGLAGDDDDLVVADGRRDLVVPLADRQLGREGDVHNAGDSPPRPRKRPPSSRRAGAENAEHVTRRSGASAISSAFSAPPRAVRGGAGSGCGQGTDTGDPTPSQDPHRPRHHSQSHDPHRSQPASPGRSGRTQRGERPRRRRGARPDHSHRPQPDQPGHRRRHGRLPAHHPLGRRRR